MICVLVAADCALFAARIRNQEKLDESKYDADDKWNEFANEASLLSFLVNLYRKGPDVSRRFNEMHATSNRLGFEAAQHRDVTVWYARWVPTTFIMGLWLYAGLQTVYGGMEAGDFLTLTTTSVQFSGTCGQARRASSRVIATSRARRACCAICARRGRSCAPRSCRVRLPPAGGGRLEQNISASNDARTTGRCHVETCARGNIETCAAIRSSSCSTA